MAVQLHLGSFVLELVQTLNSEKPTMTYRSRQIADNAYEITTDFDGASVTFNVIVACDESEVPELIEHHLNYLSAPAPVYSEPEPVPEPTAAEKLAAAGLTVDELKQLLGL